MVELGIIFLLNLRVQVVQRIPIPPTFRVERFVGVCYWECTRRLFWYVLLVVGTEKENEEAEGDFTQNISKTSVPNIL